MKSIFLSLCSIFLTISSLHSQKENNHESIAYADGSFFNGNTISQNEDEILFALYSVADTITLYKVFIEKWINSDDHFIYKKGRYHKKNGWFNNLVYSFGANANDYTSQFQFIRGKLIKPKVGVGLGVGISWSSVFNVHWDDLPFAEFYGYGKYYINDSRRRLFLDAKVGIALPLDSNNWVQYSAGPQFQTGLGFEFAKSTKRRWSFKLGHLLQYTRISGEIERNNIGRRPFNVEFRDNRVFNRILFGVGMNF